MFLLIFRIRKVTLCESENYHLWKKTSDVHGSFYFRLWESLTWPSWGILMSVASLPSYSRGPSITVHWMAQPLGLFTFLGQDQAISPWPRSWHIQYITEPTIIINYIDVFNCVILPRLFNILLYCVHMTFEWYFLAQWGKLVKCITCK